MERGITHVTGRMYTCSVCAALFHRLNAWLWRRWDSADLLSFWQACFSRAAKSPFHTCQAVLCFWGIPSIFPLLLFQRHGSNPVWGYLCHPLPPPPSPRRTVTSRTPFSGFRSYGGIQSQRCSLRFMGLYQGPAPVHRL